MRDGSETRRRIEQEAIRLFARKGVEATSMRELAEAVGVTEGALYRHTSGKDDLARGLFASAYAELAAEILRAERGAPFPQAARAVIAVFCHLFDSNRDLFAFLLLAQHDYLASVPVDAGHNVVEAVKRRFVEAIGHGELPAGDAEELTAMALGVVAQMAIFTIYGRLEGPLSPRIETMTGAILALSSGGQRLRREPASA